MNPASGRTGVRGFVRHPAVQLVSFLVVGVYCALVVLGAAISSHWLAAAVYDVALAASCYFVLTAPWRRARLERMHASLTFRDEGTRRLRARRARQALREFYADEDPAVRLRLRVALALSVLVAVAVLVLGAVR